MAAPRTAIAQKAATAIAALLLRGGLIVAMLARASAAAAVLSDGHAPTGTPVHSPRMSTERTTVLPPWMPSPALLLGFVAGVILLGVTVAKGLQDADAFWHVVAGQVIVESGSVPSTDPFSFTYGGQPWTPHEWLGEVLMYVLDDRFGVAGSLLAFGLLAGAIPVVHAVALGRLGVRTPAIAAAVAIGTVVMFPYVTVRPQVISWVFMTGLLWLLFSLRPDRPMRLLALPLLFLAWANLHGLYVVGFGFIGMYALFTLAGRTSMAPRRWWLVGACLLAVMASMLTPAGPEGLLYPLRYIDAGDWGLANIQEWQSPDFHNPAHWPFLVLLIALIATGGRGAPGWLVVLSWVTVAMGLISLRNVPIAAVVAIPVLAMSLDSRLPAPRPMSARTARGRRLAELVVAAIVMVASLLILVPSDPAAASASGVKGRYPVAALDRLASANPDARVLAEYGWGGYVISRLYDTGGRVFIDGRNDMYGDELLEEYSTVREAEEGWEEIVDRHEVEVLLFPPRSNITRGFAEDAGWCVDYRDEVQVLLVRC